MSIAALLPVDEDCDSREFTDLPPSRTEHRSTSPFNRHLGAWQIIQLCLWSAMVLSTWDVSVLAVRKFLVGQFLFANNHIFWTATPMHAVTFMTIGLLSVFSARRAAAFATIRFVTFLLAFLGVWSSLASFTGLHPTAEVLLAAGAAAQLSRLADRHAKKLLRCVRSSLPWLALGHLAVAGLVVGVGNWSQRSGEAALPPLESAAPNVLLVVLDTVGANAIDLGHVAKRPIPRADTPTLRQWAAGGVNFGHAISAAPWTLPAHASMFTGRHAIEHGATWHRPPEERYTTLAEQLKSRGYLTGGFVGNSIYCSRETGLAKGFLHYEDYELGAIRLMQSTPLGRCLLDLFNSSRIDRIERKSAQDVTGPFLRWLDDHRVGQPGGRPFFAFLNYFDAHDPYVAPPVYAEHLPEQTADRVAIRDWWYIEKQSLTPQQVALGLYGYLDCIRFLDHHFGQLLDELANRGVLENTIVVVTADHGEHFGDHELYGHGNSLYEALVHVPLVISWPSVLPSGKLVEETVSVADLPATIVELTGGAPETSLPGDSLSRHWEGDGGRSSRSVLSQLAGPSAFPPTNGRSPIFAGPMSAIYADGYKYIRSGDEEELYELRVDPTESLNLAESPDHEHQLELLRSWSSGATD